MSAPRSSCFPITTARPYLPQPPRQRDFLRPKATAWAAPLRFTKHETRQRHRRCVAVGEYKSFTRPQEGSAMHMSGESLLVILLVGLIAGWLAGQIVQGTGFGIVGDLIIGVIGAFIGSWVLPRLGIHLGAGIIAAIVNATIGALIL